MAFFNSAYRLQRFPIVAFTVYNILYSSHCKLLNPQMYAPQRTLNKLFKVLLHHQKGGARVN